MAKRNNKPFISYTNEYGDYVSKEFDTYRLLIKSLKNVLDEHSHNVRGFIRYQNLRDYVSVVRSKGRGGWNEWFEHWKLVDGKLSKIKEGWM
jgi:hypothetical protein